MKTLYVLLAALLIGTMDGCKHYPADQTPSADTTAFPTGISAVNIHTFDSFAENGRVRLLWYAGISMGPPYREFRELRVFISSTSPDHGFREIARRRPGMGSDSMTVEGLTDGTLYYFRAATYDSLGAITSLSQPLMTIPGTTEEQGITIPAPVREWPEYVSNLSWSSDGERLAFLKSVNEAVNIYVLQLSTMTVTQVTNYTGTGYRLLSVHWSPDDQWLSYCYTPTASAASIDYRIWLVSPAGGAAHSVTSGPVDAGDVWVSVTTMVFTKGTVGPPNIPELYRLDLANGNRESPFTGDQTLRKYEPAINPGRTTLVLRASSVTASDQSGLFLLHLTVPMLAQLTSHASDIHPSWSVDGQSVFFASRRSGHYEIWSVDVQTKQLRQLTRCQVPDFHRFYGRQSPDGKSLALVETRTSFNDSVIRIISVR